MGGTGPPGTQKVLPRMTVQLKGQALPHVETVSDGISPGRHSPARDSSKWPRQLPASLRTEGAPAGPRPHVDTTALLTSGRQHVVAGERQLARRDFEQAFEADPQRVEAAVTLGDLHMEDGRYGAAAELYSWAEGLAPCEPALPWRIGRAHLANWTPEDGIEALLRAKGMAPAPTELLLDIARTYRQLGASSSALPHLQEVLALSPRDPAALSLLGSVLSEMGDFDGAARNFRAAMAEGAHRSLHLCLIALYPSSHDEESLLGEVEEALGGDDRTDPAATQFLHQAAAAICARLGRTANAFGHTLQAKAAVPVRFERHMVQERYEAVRSLFDRPFLEARRTRGNSGESPIFIVGMPRSGSTLLEAALSSHAALTGIGERNYVDVIARSMHYEADIEKFSSVVHGLTPEARQGFSADYMRKAHLVAPAGQRVINKMLHNYQHVGLILTLFPRARILHSRRNPLDTCLSIFTNPLEHSHSYAGAMDDLAWQYAQYMQMMEHWRSAAPECLYEIDYESLVTAPEETMAGVFEFLEVPRSDSRVTVQPPAVVQTMSRWQVRQGIYQSSVGRWADYREQLAPLVSSLQKYGVGVTDR